jgi:3-methyladenine DNA glycosylase AlkD
MAGSTEIQINDQETALRDLANAVASDRETFSSLTAFLERCDQANAQQALLAEKGNL